MSNCIQCKKELEQTPGKRIKKFCGPTCRSNYWYARNKRPTQLIKEEVGKTFEKERSSKKTVPGSPRGAFMSDAIKKKMGLK